MDGNDNNTNSNDAYLPSPERIARMCAAIRRRNAKRHAARKGEHDRDRDDCSDVRRRQVVNPYTWSRLKSWFFEF